MNGGNIGINNEQQSSNGHNNMPNSNNVRYLLDFQHKEYETEKKNRSKYMRSICLLSLLFITFTSFFYIGYENSSGNDEFSSSSKEKEKKEEIAFENNAPPSLEKIKNDCLYVLEKQT